MKSVEYTEVFSIVKPQSTSTRETFLKIQKNQMLLSSKKEIEKKNKNSTQESLLLNWKSRIWRRPMKKPKEEEWNQ